MILSTLGVTAFALARLVVGQNTATSASDVAAAAATAKTESPTSHVPGKAFDRFVVIWLENTDYSAAAADRTCHLSYHLLPHTNFVVANLAWLAKKGITLNESFAVTHPSSVPLQVLGSPACWVNVMLEQGAKLRRSSRR